MSLTPKDPPQYQQQKNASDFKKRKMLTIVNKLPDKRALFFQRHSTPLAE
jgi:hypothetical protein